MKIACNKELKNLNGALIIADQKQEIEVIGGQPIPKLTGGHPLTVGDVLSNVLIAKKVNQFNALKAYALAQRLYKSETTDVDEGDWTGLRSMMEEQEMWTPLVAAQVLQVLMDAKDKVDKKSK